MKDIKITGTAKVRARLRGMDGGGWKGNQDYIGEVEVLAVNEEGGDARITLDIPYVKPFGLGSACLARHIEFDGGETVHLHLKSEKELRCVFLQLHRDDVEDFKAVIADRTEPLPITDESAVPLPPNFKERYKINPAAVPFEAMREAMGEFEAKPFLVGVEQKYADITADLMATVPVAGSSDLSRGMAMALVRHAVKNPGAVVSYRIAAPWLPSAGLLHVELGRLLVGSGLDKFAESGVAAFRLEAPTEGAETYEWTKAVEHFLTPAFTLQTPAFPAK